jgi:hypothetical protein
MGKRVTLAVVFACAVACGKSSGGGGDRTVVDCNRLNRRVSNCLSELAFGQVGVDQTGASPMDTLMSAIGGRIGTDCPAKQGKLEDARAVNECLGKSKCEEMAACFDKLVR